MSLGSRIKKAFKTIVTPIKALFKEPARSSLVNVNVVTNPKPALPIMQRKPLKFSPPALAQKPPKPLIVGDYIDITSPQISNQSLQDFELNHIATLRPEILAATELYPLYPDEAATGQNLTSIGKLVTFKYQTQKLKFVLLKSLVENMAKGQFNTSLLLDNIDKKFEIVNATRSEFSELASIQRTLNSKLNFRNYMNDNILFDKQYKKDIDSSFGKAIVKNLSILPVSEFIETITGYSKKQLNNFTNTKIFMTLCSDLEQALSEGVYGSLEQEIDKDRIEDFNPVNVDLTHTTEQKIKTEILNANFGSDNQTVLTQPVKFTTVQSSLSKDPYQRLIFGLNFLSKELTNSKFLIEFGKKTNTDINGNFYKDMFGKPGSTIFDPVIGEKSVITVCSLQDQQRNATIFPFENVFIENETANSQLSQKYIPGKRYFVETIFDGLAANTQDLNLAPLKSYCDRNNAIFQDTINKLNSIIEIKKSFFAYNANQTFKYMLGQMDVSSIGLTRSNRASSEQAFAIALLRKCWEDENLKLMIFQFLIYLGIYLRKVNSSQDQYIIFDTIATEIGSTDNLHFLKNPPLENIQVVEGTSQLQTISFTNITQVEVSTVAHQLNIFARNIARYIVQKNIKTKFVNRERDLLSNDQVGINLSEETIFNFLTKFTENRNTVVKGTILFDIFDYIHSLDSITKNNFFSNAGGTKFHGCKANAMFFIIFDTYVSFTKIFGFCDFSLSTTSEKHIIKKRRRTDFKNTNIFKSEDLENIDEFLENLVPTKKDYCTVIISWYKHDVSRRKIESLIGNNFIVQTNNHRRGILNPVELHLENEVLTIANAKFDNNKVRIELDETINPVNRSFEHSITSNAIPDLYVLYGADPQPTVELNGFSRQPEVGCKIYEIYSKMWNEDWYYLLSIKGFFEVLNSNFVQTIKNNVNVLTNPRKFPTIRGTKVRPEIENLRIFDQAMADFVQIRGIVTQNKTNEDVKRFFTNLTPNKVKLDILFSLFKEDSYLPFGNASETRKRVLTIGIPNGMVDSLRQKKLLSSINNQTTGTSFFTEQEGYENDIISINVYRKDLRFEHLVFKPKSYLFDTSVFINEESLNFLKLYLSKQSINPNSLTFDELVTGIRFDSYSEGFAFTPEKIIYKNNRYATSIPENKRFEILRNTVESYFLQYYISLTTGMIIDEKTFSVSNEQPEELISLSNVSNFLTEVFRYMQQNGENVQPTKSLKENIENPNIGVKTKLLLELINSTSIILDPGSMYKKLVNNPLSFDRVFHILETADAYEIDIDKTKLTSEGRALLNNDKFNESLVRIGDSWYLPFTGMDDVSLSDYFVDIEVVNF